MCYQSKKQRLSMLNKDYLCGVGDLRSAWIQSFASTKMYAVVFAVLGVFQTAYRSYLVGTLSTVEKRFSMSSKQCSIIMIGDDISPIIASVFIMFFMKDSSKPTWITLGMITSGLGCLASMFPFIYYGPARHFGVLNPNETLPHVSVVVSPSTPLELCGTPQYNDPRCASRGNDGSMSVIPLWSLFLGNFLNGIGGTAYYVLGTAYLDDNVKKKNSAIYLGAIYFVRMFGPILGFMLSSRTLRLWESPSSSSGGLTPKDPRWIGAWWMGYIVIGIGLCVMAMPMIFFPKKIRAKSEANLKEHKKDESLMTNLRKAFATIKRVIRCPVFSFRMIGFIFGYIALAGYYINFPKYLEHQFQRTASQASAITSPVYLLSNALGIVIGGAITHFFKPRPRFVAVHCFLAHFLVTIGFYFLAKIECPVMDTIVDSCSGCDCLTSMFTPVCEPVTRQQFFSPCFAGCSQIGNGSRSFLNCSCLGTKASMSLPGAEGLNKVPPQVTSGKCPVECESILLTYSAIVFCTQVLLSTTYVGGNLLLLRSILPEDKSVALAFQNTCFNLFAFIPYPILFSFVMDLSCDVWEDKCGAVGACWLYNLPKMRMWMHNITLIPLVICTIFQGLVFIFSGSIVNFYEDPEDRKEYTTMHYDKSPIAHKKNGKRKNGERDRPITPEIRTLHLSLLNMAQLDASGTLPSTTKEEQNKKLRNLEEPNEIQELMHIENRNHQT